MSHFRTFAMALSAPLMLAGCTTMSAPGPVEVTRFHDANLISQIGQGTVFIESAPGEGENSLEISAYKRAIAAELLALGYTETNRADASHIAQVRLDRYAIGSDGGRRGPVSVGVGGSTGSYGSGVGVGIGINLGGGRNRERVGTEVGVILRDVATSATLWEGRAQMEVARGSDLAEPAANAQIVADALFDEFPGGDGETIEVEVGE